MSKHNGSLLTNGIDRSTHRARPAPASRSASTTEIDRSDPFPRDDPRSNPDPTYQQQKQAAGTTTPRPRRQSSPAMTTREQQREQQQEQHGQSVSALIEALSATASDTSEGASSGLPGTEAAVGIEVIDNGLDAAALRARAADYRAQPLLVRGDPALAQWPAVFEALGLVPSEVASAPALNDGGDEKKDKDQERADAAGWVPSKVYRISLDPAALRFDRREGPVLREEDIQAEVLSDPYAGLLKLLRGVGGPAAGVDGRPASAWTTAMLYAYGPLDVERLQEQQPPEEQPAFPPSWSTRAPCLPRDLLARLPLPACLRRPPAAAAASSTQEPGQQRRRRPGESSDGGAVVVGANLWLGANVTSRIHVDAHDNLLCVAAGSKIVHLYAPFQLDLLALGPPDRLPVESALRSSIFHTASSWPRGLARVVARVEAGEALFIPGGWAHEVLTIAALFTAAVSLWCTNPDPRRIGLRPTLLHLASGGRFGSFVAGLGRQQAQEHGPAGTKRGLEEDEGKAEEARVRKTM